MAIDWLRKAVTIDPGNRAAWGNLKKLGVVTRP
jgi:hypothetical protein